MERFRELVELVTRGIGVIRDRGPSLRAAPVQAFALGGIVRPGELSLVGEAGPELVSAPGSNVVPIRPSIDAPSIDPGVLEHPAHLYLDGRLIRSTTATAT